MNAQGKTNGMGAIRRMADSKRAPMRMVDGGEEPVLPTDPSVAQDTSQPLQSPQFYAPGSPQDPQASVSLFPAARGTAQVLPDQGRKPAPVIQPFYKPSARSQVPPLLRMADGGTVSPYSIRGLHRRAVEGATNLMEKVAPIQSATERYNAAHPPVQQPAAPVQPAAPPAPTPVYDGSEGSTPFRMRDRPAMRDGGEIPAGIPDRPAYRPSGLADQITAPVRTKPAPLDMSVTRQAPKPPPVGAPADKPRMAAGGALRTGAGGVVPGKGRGDKIDAKYEPGEFVVSNAMLDAEPGLIRKLHTLRNQTLAEQGKTPEQADAGRFKGGAIRALAGLDPVEDERRARLLAQIPTGGDGQIQGGERINSSELGRNVANTLSAITPVAPVLTGARALANASTLAPKVGGIISNLASRAAPAAPYAVPAAGAAALHAASSPAVGAPAQTPTPAPGAAAPVIAQPAAPGAPGAASSPPADPQTQRVTTVPSSGAQDMALANQMEGERLAQQAAHSAGEQASLKVGQDISDRIDRERARKNMETSMSSVTRSPADKALIAQRIQGLDAQEQNAQTLQSGERRGAVADATARRGQDIQAAGQGAISRLSREKFALESEGTKLDNASKKRVADAQAKLLDANASEADRSHARETLRALLGRDKEVPNRFTVVPEYDGNGTRTGTTVLDQAGQVVNTKQPAQNSTTKAQYDALPKGSKYTAPDGSLRIKG